jgi:hypothetical protein
MDYYICRVDWWADGSVMAQVPLLLCCVYCLVGCSRRTIVARVLLLSVCCVGAALLSSCAARWAGDVPRLLCVRCSLRDEFLPAGKLLRKCQLPTHPSPKRFFPQHRVVGC